MVSILRYPTHRTRFTPSKHSFERLPLPLHEIYPNERIAQVIPGIRGRFLTGTTRQSTFQPASPIQLLPGISWKSSIVSWGAFPARRVLRIRQLIDRQPGDGTKGDGAGRPAEPRREDEGVVAWRAESYVMNTLYLRFQGMLAHAPMGWLHPVLHRDPPCLSPLPPPFPPSSGHRTLLSVPALIIHALLTNPPPTRQGLACLSPSARGEGSTTLVPTRRSLGGAWTIPRALALLNYAEALTGNLGQPLEHRAEPFRHPRFDWLSLRSFTKTSRREIEFKDFT